MKVRVRIAPSPTGIPHIGNTRTALFNFLFARHHKGNFILRIEDTDRARIVAGAEKAIHDIFEWLGFSPDEMYKQSNRQGIYKEHAEELKKKDLAYEDDGALRFRMSKEGETSWQDAIGNKHVLFKNENQEDFVIIKSDGYPTYNFANVVDDRLMKITHVIRGDEFISSTPKHLQLYGAFGWEPPTFAHLPVILGPDKAKLSKRHGAKSVLDYRMEGYLKEALINYMALLGWNMGDDKEILSLAEMIKAFDLKDINTSSAVFDAQKLLWMNGVYIRKLTDKELEHALLKYDPNLHTTLDDIPGKKGLLLDLAKSRMKTLADFKKLLSKSAERTYTKEEKKLAKELLDFLTAKDIDAWDQLLVILKEFSKEKNIPMKQVYFLLTQQEHGLPLSELMATYGKEFFLHNLKKNT